MYAQSSYITELYSVIYDPPSNHMFWGYVIGMGEGVFGLVVIGANIKKHVNMKESWHPSEV